MIIKVAEIEDLAPMVEIYNQAIETKISTGHTTKMVEEDLHYWFFDHCPDTYPIFIAEINGQTVGWISISPYKPGCEALKQTAEISYYVHNDFHRQGIGSALVKYAIENCGKFNIKTLFAILLEQNTNSIELLQKLGFEKWGHMPNVAVFDGIESGQYYYGLRVCK